MEIRALQPGDAQACDAIIAGLPDWFGNERGIAECAEAVRSQAGFVATDAGGAQSGFVTWEPRDPGSAEITWMAVRADVRRGGTGRRLIEALADALVEGAFSLLLVKTLSERDAYAPYEETRRFYRAVGFVRVAELDIWGPEDPASLFAKSLPVR